MIPMVFLTSKENTQVITDLAKRFFAWQKQWCIQSLQYSFKRTQDINIPEDFWFLTNEPSADIPSIGVKYSGDFTSFLFGDNAHLVPKDEVSQGIVQDAIASLIKELSGVKHAGTCSVEQQRPLAQGKFFRYFLNADNGGVVAEIIIPETLILSFINRYESLRYDDLVHVNQCFRKQKAMLNVVLPLNELNLQSISGLQKGDILVTQKRLTADVKLLINNREIATASLGKKGAVKALQIKEINHE